MPSTSARDDAVDIGAFLAVLCCFAVFAVSLASLGHVHSTFAFLPVDPSACLCLVVSPSPSSRSPARKCTSGTSSSRPSCLACARFFPPTPPDLVFSPPTHAKQNTSFLANTQASWTRLSSVSSSALHSCALPCLCLRVLTACPAFVQTRSCPTARALCARGRCWLSVSPCLAVCGGHGFRVVLGCLWLSVSLV